MFVDGWTSRGGAMYVFLIISRDKFKTTLLPPLRRVLSLLTKPNIAQIGH